MKTSNEHLYTDGIRVSLSLNASGLFGRKPSKAAAELQQVMARFNALCDGAKAQAAINRARRAQQNTK